MKYYCELKLFEDTEISLGFLWHKLYGELHAALVRIKRGDNTVSIGVSFPDYGNTSFPLGHRLRIFSLDEETLRGMEIDSIYKKYADYIKIEPISEVPQAYSHAHFFRRQFKTNPDRLARRYAKRHNVAFDEALKRFKSLDEAKVIKKNALPFINLHSHSTDQRHRLYIDRNIVNQPVIGTFNTFGLSKKATVPLF